MSGRTHSPKKKHVKRPRPPPVVPLTDVERSAKAGSEFRKALVHLDEAERMARWGGAPNACVHAAYYAMHHCAAAAILAAGGVGKRGDAPPSHEHVIQHFGKLVAGETGDLGRCGMVLNRARGDRTVADYGLLESLDNVAAAAVTADARVFIAACRAKWGFPGAPPDGAV